MSWLEKRLAEIGKKKVDAARAIGKPQQRIREINRGLRQIQQAEWEPLARFLEWTVAELHAAALGTGSDRQIPSAGMQANPRSPNVRQLTAPLHSSARVMPFPMTDEAIPVWLNRPVGAGVLYIERRVVDTVPRSEFLRYALYSFGLEVMNDEMSPAFERRDVVVVNPDRAVQAGDDVLLVKGYEEKAATPFSAQIRRLVRETDTHWVVRQFNPARDYKLDKAEWTRALHVAGKRSR